ncbi:MAG TPA: hypothetical protein VF600_01070 [Abditibacteriaceae bacterium]
MSAFSVAPSQASGERPTQAKEVSGGKRVSSSQPTSKRVTPVQSSSLDAAGLSRANSLVTITLPGAVHEGATSKPTPEPTPSPDEVLEKKIQTAINDVVGEGKVKVSLVAGGGNKAIVLSGKPAPDTVVNQAMAVATAFVNAGAAQSVINVITSTTPTPVPWETAELDVVQTQVWPLTFLPDTVSSTQGNKGAPTPTPTPTPAGTPSPSNHVEVTVNTTGGTATSSSSAAAASGGPSTPPTGIPSPTGGAKAAESAGKDAVDVLVDRLNAIFGQEDPQDKTRKVIVQRRNHHLFLTGPQRSLLQIRELLALIDSPAPQVQLDMWAFQVSGPRETVAKQVQKIRNRIDGARFGVELVRNDLFQIIANRANERNIFGPTSSDSQLAPLLDLLRRNEFDTNPIRPLSLNEMLIFLGLADATNRKGIITELRQKTRNRWWTEYIQKRQLHANLLGFEKAENQVEQLEEDMNDLAAKLNIPQHTLFGVLEHAFDAQQYSVLSDRKGIYDFVRAYSYYRELVTTPHYSRKLQHDQALVHLLSAPDEFRRHSAVADSMLKAGMAALTADLQAIFLGPLWKDAGPVGNKSGVELTGKTRLVVSSGLETGLTPTIGSYTNTTNPAPVNMQFLTDVFGSAGIASLLPGFSGAQLAAVGLALSQPEPEITKVAPGVEIYVRPSVLPDAGSARLQIDARFGVMTTVQARATTGGTWKSVPADAVQSHHVRTDAIISVFDLFDISSFSLETTHPRSRAVPLIGSIPILNDLIKKPPKNDVKHHESIVLVNAVIIPRSVDIGFFYNFYNPRGKTLLRMDGGKLVEEKFVPVDESIGEQYKRDQQTLDALRALRNQ